MELQTKGQVIYALMAQPAGLPIHAFIFRALEQFSEQALEAGSVTGLDEEWRGFAYAVRAAVRQYRSDERHCQPLRTALERCATPREADELREAFKRLALPTASYPYGSTVKLAYLNDPACIGWAHRGENGELLSAVRRKPLDAEAWAVLEERAVGGLNG